MAAIKPKILTITETESKQASESADTSVTPATPALKDFSDNPDKSAKKTEKRAIVPFFEMFKSIPEKSETIISQNFKHIFTADNQQWYRTLNCDQLAHKMASGEIVEVMDMRQYLALQNKTAQFTNEVYLVCVENTARDGEKEYCKAVFKPKTPEAIAGAYAEVAAFQASRFLAKFSGRHLVPPTIIKEYGGRVGSLQWYIESPLDLWIETDRFRAYKDIAPEDLANGAAFVHVFGQWDVHPGNQIMTYDAAGFLQLVLIDNEGICTFKNSRSMMERPFISIAHHEKASAVSTTHHVIQTLKTPTLKELSEAFKYFDFDETLLKNLHTYLCRDGKYDMNYMIRKNSLWVQYYSYSTSAFPNHVDSYPKYVETAYSTLDLKNLKQFFELGRSGCPDRFNDNFFKGILNRRNQLLSFIRKPTAMPISVPAAEKESVSVSSPVPIPAASQESDSVSSLKFS